MNANEEMIGFCCQSAAHAYGLRLEQQTVQLGLHGGEVGVLFRLCHHGPESLSSLARALGRTHPTLVKQVASLAAQGLIEKQFASRDRRVKVIVLTAQGHVAARKVTRIVRAMNAHVVSTLGVEKSNALMHMLHELLLALDSLPEQRNHTAPRVLNREVAR